MLSRVIGGLLVAVSLASAGPKQECKKDVLFAVKRLEKDCRKLLQTKRIKWSKVASQTRREATKVKTTQDHYDVLVRLIARLRDGHAYVKPAKGVDVKWPGVSLAAGPGIFLCRNSNTVLVKNAWSNAAKEGVAAGQVVTKIEGKPAAAWLDERVAQLSEYASFSTPQHALFFTCHWGLGGPTGSKLALTVKSAGKKAKTVEVRRGNASIVPSGPVFAPKDVRQIGRQSYGKTAKGYGYIHLRDTKREIEAQLDTALAALKDVPGLILDFRANGGGAFDHDAVLGRFVAIGNEMRRAKAYPIPSKGPNPYAGRIVVIIDAGARSAGETGSGMFKEDGRAYMIGESATAGMSSSKVTIDLPSGKFSLYVSVRSNKSRFQGGKGIEGIGIQPHEVVPYDAADLAAGIDTLIKRAEEILADFPDGKVPYKAPKQ